MILKEFSLHLLLGGSAICPVSRSTSTLLVASLLSLSFETLKHRSSLSLLLAVSEVCEIYYLSLINVRLLASDHSIT